MLRCLLPLSLILFGVLLSSLCFGSDVPTIGSIADKLTIGTDLLTRFMVAVCIVMGVGLIITGLTLYKAHRNNPKFVPLDRPVMYAVLGLLVILIPFLGEIFGPTGSSLDLKKRQAAESCPTNIDAPLELGNEFDH